MVKLDVDRIERNLPDNYPIETSQVEWDLLIDSVSPIFLTELSRLISQSGYFEYRSRKKVFRNYHYRGIRRVDFEWKESEEEYAEIPNWEDMYEVWKSHKTDFSKILFEGYHIEVITDQDHESLYDLYKTDGYVRNLILRRLDKFNEEWIVSQAPSSRHWTVQNNTHIPMAEDIEKSVKTWWKGDSSKQEQKTIIDYEISDFSTNRVKRKYPIGDWTQRRFAVNLNSKEGGLLNNESIMIVEFIPSRKNVLYELDEEWWGKNRKFKPIQWKYPDELKPIKAALSKSIQFIERQFMSQGIKNFEYESRELTPPPETVEDFPKSISPRQVRGVQGTLHDIILGYGAVNPYLRVGESDEFLTRILTDTGIHEATRPPNLDDLEEYRKTVDIVEYNEETIVLNGVDRLMSGRLWLWGYVMNDLDQFVQTLSKQVGGVLLEGTIYSTDRHGQLTVSSKLFLGGDELSDRSETRLNDLIEDNYLIDIGLVEYDLDEYDLVSIFQQTNPTLNNEIFREVRERFLDTRQQIYFTGTSNTFDQPYQSKLEKKWSDENIFIKCFQTNIHGVSRMTKYVRK